MICEEQNNVVERQDSLVMVIDCGVRELEEGLELKQTRIDSENNNCRWLEMSRG